MNKKNLSFAVLATALIVIIAFCLISSISGLVSLYSYKQMVETQIVVGGYGVIVPSEVTENLTEVSSKSITIAYVGLSLILLNAFHAIKPLIKNKKPINTINIVISAICVVALITAIILCIIVISQSFDLVNTLPAFNDYFPDGKNYYHYMYLQSYQGAMLSTYIPFMIASVFTALANIVNIVLSKITFKKTDGEITVDAN